MNDSHPKRSNQGEPAADGNVQRPRRAHSKQAESTSGATRARPTRSTRAKSDHNTRPGVYGAIVSVRDFASELGWEITGISGVTRDEEGWVVSVDVVELHRTPSTTDLIAVYEVGVDRDHEVTAYTRNRHYVRGRGDNERAAGSA